MVCVEVSSPYLMTVCPETSYPVLQMERELLRQLLYWNSGQYPETMFESLACWRFPLGWGGCWNSDLISLLDWGGYWVPQKYQLLLLIQVRMKSAAIYGCLSEN